MAKFNLNEASLLCKVGKEPEKRSTQSGLVVVSLLCVTIAPEYKTSDGTLIPERKTWHNVIITKSSEMDYVLGNVHVGDVVYVEGRVHNRVTEVNGEKRYMLEIECDMFKKIVSQPTENVGTWQKIRIGGGVGRDPEIKTLPSGSKVATFSIATSEGGYVDKNGNKVVDYIYDDATEQNSCGYVAVKKDGKWGSLDKNGDIVIEPTYNLDENIRIDFIGQWHIGKDPNMNCYTK